MSNNNDNLSEEDYLKKHLGDIESNHYNSDIPINNEEKVETDSSKVEELNYFNFSVDQLPCGQFYPKGTLIMVRPAQVREIQAYSMVDDNNFYDIVEKMNDMLQSCIRVKYTDGTVGSYLEVKDQDRLFLIFLIRELTFQQGNELSVKAKSPCDDGEVNVELKRENFVFHQANEKLDKFYNKSSFSYSFKLKNGKKYEMAPPTIGIQKSFTDYIVKENQEEKSPNLSFLKIIPFMLPGRKSISYDGIKSKLKEFQEMDDVSFQFLNSAVSKMTFGIKELKKQSECGQEIRTKMTFPNGASGIFVIHDAFEAYIEE